MTGLTLTTGAGFWNPVMLIFSLLIVIALVYLIRSSGEKKYKGKTEQTASFFSGARAADEISVRNVYWGFFSSMEKYYKWLKRAHTGIVNDYIYWFVLTLTIILITLTLGGLL